MDKTHQKASIKPKRKNLLRYYGSKYNIAPWILSFVTQHICYVETHFGGGSVFFRKKPSKLEIINDISRDVVNFFYVVRDHLDEFIRVVELTPYARDEMELTNLTVKNPPKWVWNSDTFRFEPEGISPIELARRFYVRSRQGRTGNTSAWRTTWRPDHNGKRTKSLLQEFNEVDHIYACCNMLKMAQIENTDALDVIRRYDEPETFFYLDPPYLHETRGSNWTYAYQHEMSRDDHAALAERLNRINGMAIISGYPSAFYKELYEDRAWHLETTTTRDNLGQEKTEAVWINPKTWDRYQVEKSKKRKAKQISLLGDDDEELLIRG
jgi:DNA adenine methylase